MREDASLAPGVTLPQKGFRENDADEVDRVRHIAEVKVHRLMLDMRVFVQMVDAAGVERR